MLGPVSKMFIPHKSVWLVAALRNLAQMHQTRNVPCRRPDLAQKLLRPRPVVLLVQVLADSGEMALEQALNVLSGIFS